MMAKILIMTIQVNLVPNLSKMWRRQSKFILLKFLPLAYHHSHFLAATLGFASFFYNGLHTFTAGLDIHNLIKEYG